MQLYAAEQNYGYSATKADVIQVSKMLAKNYGTEIRVNVIYPGVVDKPIFTNRDFSRFHDIIPMGRITSPDENAKLVDSLASDDASFINGAQSL